MDSRQLDQVLADLGTITTHGIDFSYHHEEFALLLLGWALDRPRPVHELRRTAFGRLLKKAAAREALAQVGKRFLTADDLVLQRKAEHLFHLTLGRWGGGPHEDDQTTRQGENLVVQLNFPLEHDGAYRRLVDPKEARPFDLRIHPIVKDGRCTMAWARVDLDLARREALVEEVQNDWLRYARDAYDDAKEALEGDDPHATVDVDDLVVEAAAMVRYYERVLGPFQRVWAEATLCAALWVLREKLGITRVWLHTFEGSCLKGPDCVPPKSLYRDLPRRFCFEKTFEKPGFLSVDDTPVLAERCGPEAAEPLMWHHLRLG